MELKLAETEHCEFWIAEPEEGEVVRPLVYVGDANSYFKELASLRAMVNGTFFNAQSREMYVLGDLKTDLRLVWRVTLKTFNIQVHGDHHFYWSPAAEAPGVAGYENRWALAMGFDGKAQLVQGNQTSYAKYREDEWVMGGGLPLLKDGAIPFASERELAKPEHGGFAGSQNYSTQRSMLMVNAEGAVHLGVNRTALGPLRIAQRLQELGYTNALMLDGGGAATLGYRDENRAVQFKLHHNRQRYPVLHSAVGILKRDEQLSP